MATFLLVHGGLHGGWCWEKVVPLLKRAGHEALAPDLPGSGNDDLRPEDVTLQRTGGFVADLARAQSEPVILVGHSLGGITISEAAERAPEAILGLVYLAAILLPNGQQAFGNLKAGSGHSNAVRMSEDQHVLIGNPEAAAGVFFSGCDAADVQAALARLTPQPTRPMRDILELSPERYGAIPRAYIECLEDNAHPLPLQRSQQQAQPCDPVYRMATGHSPFLQAPEALVEHLLAIAVAFEQRRR